MALPRASELPRDSVIPESLALQRSGHYLSLRTRLRVSVVLLVTVIVLFLSLLHVDRVAHISFDDVYDRATLVAQEAKNLVVHRVAEVADGRRNEARTSGGVRQLWSDIIRNDASITSMLEQTMAASKLVVEILVRDQSGVILASSRADHVGEFAKPLATLPLWTDASPVERTNLLLKRQDYAYRLQIGTQGAGGQALFTIEAVVSSVLIWDMLRPQIVQVAFLNIVALTLAILAAIVFSNVALRPVESIAQALDRIAKGEELGSPSPARFRSTEVADVHSKLNLLGQKFRGARQDAMELRSNIEGMLDRLKDAVLLFGVDGRLVMASKSADAFFGSDVTHLAGKPLDEFFPPGTEAGELIRTALAQGHPIRERMVTLARPAGTDSPSPELRVLLNLEVLEISPRRQGILVTMRDAETRMEIQSQLDVSTRLAAISRLTGGVAHEIKNPLNAMTLHLEVLRSKIDESDPDVRATLDVIRREVGRLDRVVKTFLDFTRPVEPQMRGIDVAALLRQTSDLLRPQAQKRGCQVLYSAEPSSVWLCADPDMLNQALLNIMVNGMEAMDHGGELAIRVVEKGGECLITIADQGPGIDPKIRDKIFNLYFTTKRSGSGIGLAIAFQVVQLHNGTIDFYSKPGQGTSFRLQFPLFERDRSTESR